MIDFGVEHDIVKKSGAWFTYDGDQLGQGKENARKYLIENPDIAQSIEDKILTALGVAQIEGANVGDEAPAEEASVESLEDKRAERSA